ncbi:MAG: SDR family NAD(P)-dependent oxidoreductase [Alphaproteobacteria bacterium]
MAKPESALIFGAGPGLGAAVARRCAKDGMRVALATRTKAKVDGIARALGGEARAYACDATDADAVARVFEDASKAFGVPDLVVFNAGAYAPGSVLEIDPAEFERCWKNGCFGGFLVGQAAGRAMAARGSGTILFTGATASLRGSARFLNLAVGKFGLRAVAQSLARDLGPKGVHVAHIIIDGQIKADRPGYRAEERGPDAVMDSDAIAEVYMGLHRQHRSAWTHELDLRPWVEKF